MSVESPRRLARLLAWLGPAYLAAAVVVAVAMRAAGDRWWPATLAIFGPRWVWLAPAPFVLGASLLARAAPRRLRGVSVGACSAAVLVVLFGPMDLHASTGSSAPRTGGAELRVTTLNAGSQWLEPPDAVSSLLAVTDVLAVQECGHGSLEALGAPAGWQVRRDGLLCLLSRWPISRADAAPEGTATGGAMRYVIDAPGGSLALFNLHLMTPRDGLDEVRHRLWRGAAALAEVTRARRSQSERASAWVRSWPATAGEAVVVVGDLNTPEDSAIYRESWSWLASAFGAVGNGFGYTKHTRLIGVRIDHVLHDGALAARAARVGPQVGSDHRPMTATLFRIRPPD